MRTTTKKAVGYYSFLLLCMKYFSILQGVSAPESNR